MTSRRSLTDLQRLKVFEAGGGECHICEQKIFAGQKWDVEHVIPLSQGGADGGDNLKPAHRACHAVKSKADATRHAKTLRQRAKHVGAARPVSTLGSKVWKRKVSGETVRR